MGTQPNQTNFATALPGARRPVLIDQQAPVGGEDLMTGYSQQQQQVIADKVMGLPAARTTTLFLKGFHDCTDWYLSDPGDDPNTIDYQQTRFVEWDGALYDFKNDTKTTGVGVALPVNSTGNATWNRVAVTAPPERAVTVVVSWSVLPFADINPDGPGPVGSTSGFGAAGQVMWVSVGGPDKGIFGTGPFGFSLVGVEGLGATAWPANAHASLVVPASSTYEIALNFVAGIDVSYFNGVGRESQVVRTRLVGNYESLAGAAGEDADIPPTYFKGFSSVPEIGPAKLVDDSFSMMTVTTY